jgi:predicted acylesterase/phospholipase RssA
VVAADIERREVVTFTEGPVHRPMLASAAIPILFPPIEVNGRRLVDGGVLQPIPIRQVAELGADIVIAVKLNDPTEPPQPEHSGFSLRRIRLPVIDAVLETISAMQWQVFSDGDAQADVTVEPVFEGPTGLRDFSRGPYFTQCGVDAVGAVLEQIEMHLPWVKADSVRP